MKIHVDKIVCKNHGQCAISAPSNFWLSPEGVLQYREDFDDEIADEVEDAVDICPVQAIALLRDTSDEQQ